MKNQEKVASHVKRENIPDLLFRFSLKHRYLFHKEIPIAEERCTCNSGDKQSLAIVYAVIDSRSLSSSLPDIMHFQGLRYFP